jgi:hypothetical protein
MAGVQGEYSFKIQEGGLMELSIRLGYAALVALAMTYGGYVLLGGEGIWIGAAIGLIWAIWWLRRS